MKIRLTALNLMFAICMHGCASTPVTSVAYDSKLGGLSWLAGSWISQEGDVVVEEQWTQPRGGTMFGVNRTVHGNETAFFEYLCIQYTQDGIFYMASPKGRQPPTPFKLVRSDDKSVTFENPEHDFPQRIMYRREGDKMHARVEGMRNGQLASEEWTWRLLD
jgi:hypothetical protein